MYRLWKISRKFGFNRLANALAFAAISSHTDDILPVLLPKGATKHIVQSLVNGWYSTESTGWIHGW